MKFTKSLLVILLVCALCLCLCACISQSKAVGTWSDNYIYDGNEFSVTLVLGADGNYNKIVYKNGTLSSVTEGKWEIDGGEVCCYTKTGSISYEYKKGALVNGSQNLIKQ